MVRALAFVVLSALATVQPSEKQMLDQSELVVCARLEAKPVAANETDWRFRLAVDRVLKGSAHKQLEILYPIKAKEKDPESQGWLMDDEKIKAMIGKPRRFFLRRKSKQWILSDEWFGIDECP